MSEKPASYLHVSAYFNGGSYASLDDVADTYLRWLREDFPEAVMSRKEPARLGGLPALLFIMKYNRDGVARSKVDVVAFRPSLRLVSAGSTEMVNDPLNIVYTASVDTTEERFVEDVSILQQITRNWKLRKLE